MLKRLRHWIIEQLWRIQLVQGFYGVLVFTPLLILANSDKIHDTIPLSTFWQMVLGTPLLLGMVWAVGIIIDKYVQYQQELYTIANQRNPQITEILERCKKIEETLKRLENARQP